jgi:hypothetical protein
MLQEMEEISLGMVNVLRQRLSVFLAGFHGVSTKRLDRCMSWFMHVARAGKALRCGQAPHALVLMFTKK